jgi:hypothetical protein
MKQVLAGLEQAPITTAAACGYEEDLPLLLRASAIRSLRRSLLRLRRLLISLSLSVANATVPPIVSGVTLMHVITERS